MTALRKVFLRKTQMPTLTRLRGDPGIQWPCLRPKIFWVCWSAWAPTQLPCLLEHKPRWAHTCVTVCLLCDFSKSNATVPAQWITDTLKHQQSCFEPKSIQSQGVSFFACHQNYLHLFPLPISLYWWWSFKAIPLITWRCYASLSTRATRLLPWLTVELPSTGAIARDRTVLPWNSRGRWWLWSASRSQPNFSHCPDGSQSPVNEELHHLHG